MNFNGSSMTKKRLGVRWTTQTTGSALEAAGAAAITVGLYLWMGLAAALLFVGVALVLAAAVVR